MHVAIELHLDMNKTDAGEEKDRPSVWEKLCEDRKKKHNFVMWNWEGILPKRMGLFKKIYEYYQIMPRDRGIGKECAWKADENLV